MSRLIALLSVPFIFAICVSDGNAQPPEVSGYEINWFDEFDGNLLDESKWTPQFNTFPTNNSLQVYLPGNVAVGGGNMIILSTDIPFGDGFDFRSGQVISTTSHRMGRFEVRGKLPTSTGMWPAIWLLPDAPWPSQGEIDIMENRGNQPFLTSSAFHFGTNPPFNHQFVFEEYTARKNGNLVNFHDSFHTYAVEWDPDQIRYYVDGVHYYTVRSSSVGNFLQNAQSSPMRLIINTAIGGHFLPNPDATTQWPQFFEIDYAYVYDRVGEATLELENGDFETNNGSLSNWSLFGRSGANLSPDDSHAQSGTSALKIFGQFNGSQNFSGIEQGVTVQPGDVLRLKASAFVDANDSLAGTLNQAFIKFDYYSKNYSSFGSPDYISSQQISLANASTATNQWIDHEFTSTVPAGAVEARVVIVFEQRNFASGSVFVDDVEVVNTTSTDTVSVDSTVLSSGVNFSGQLTDLNTSDDSYYSIRSGKVSSPDQANVEIEFSGSTSFADPSSVRFELESNVNTPNLEITVEAFNFATGQFEEVETSIASLNDETVVAEIDGPADYIDPSNEMRYRVSYQPNGPTLFYPWAVNIDRVGWAVER